MRTMLLVVIATTTGLLAGGEPGNAEITYPWCAQYGAGFDGGGRNCGFSTLEQCRAAISGNGGFCEQNSMYRPGAELQAPPRKPRR
jgi:hypothetical protein